MINSAQDPRSVYFRHLRMQLLGLANQRPKRVLEVGCGTGASLSYFKSQGAEFVAGVELVPEVAEEARARPEVDAVHIGSIEDLDLPYEVGFFNLIVAGHVLEHLINPWSVVRHLRELTAPGGQLIGSIPNVRYFRVAGGLLVSGRWRYEDEGVMDWTHMRFFTHASLLDLLDSAGYIYQRSTPEFAGRRAETIDRVTFGAFQGLLAFAYNFSAFKP